MNDLPIQRQLLPKIEQALARQPAVALLGPRQVGKTTLAREIASRHKNSILLDLERDADRAQLTNPELFFHQHRDRLVIFDEVQNLPDLFKHLRPEIDTHRDPGRFLLLGSASGRLLRQSSESLAGRISYQELTPFLLREVLSGQTDPTQAILKLWLRGGFPRSYLARDAAESDAWREDFVQTFLSRDLPGLGVTIAAETIRRFWKMCAHLHGQLLNTSQLGLSLGGISHPTVARYLDMLVDAFMLRRLPPYLVNVSKRLVKSPKIYIRDSGVLHSLLGIHAIDELSSNPVAGHSWEGFVIEQILSGLPSLATVGFYRTIAGAEMDLVVESGGKKIGYEIKLSSAPKPSKGFWNACEDLGVHKAYIVAPVRDAYPLAANVEVVPVGGEF